MGFFKEAGEAAGKTGLAIVSFTTAALAAGIWLFGLPLSYALAIAGGFLFLIALLVAHGFWAQRKSIEATPEFQFDAILKQALALREVLKYNRYGISEKEQRVQTMRLIVATLSAVEDHAPAYRDDVETEQVEGAGPTQLLEVVNEYYRVLAAVRKQL